MTDEALLAEYLRTRDQDLFATLHKRMHGRLYALALEILKSPEDADDAVQDVFIRLCNLEPVEVLSAESFLYRMVQNRAIDMQRSSTAGIRDGIESMENYENDERHNGDKATFRGLNDRRRPAEMEMSKAEAIDAIKGAMAALPPAQREVVELHHCRDMTCIEIAELLNLDYITVRKRLENGMAKLRSLLDVEKTKLRDKVMPVRATDPESGAVVHEFKQVKDALSAGFNQEGLYRALKTKKPYRGLAWSYANAV